MAGGKKLQRSMLRLSGLSECGMFNAVAPTKIINDQNDQKKLMTVNGFCGGW